MKYVTVFFFFFFIFVIVSLVDSPVLASVAEPPKKTDFCF